MEAAVIAIPKVGPTIIPAGPGYAEKLTGLGTYGDSGVLWFVNPWITSTILENDINHRSTTFYIYVIIVNTGLTAYSPTAGR